MEWMARLRHLCLLATALLASTAAVTGQETGLGLEPAIRAPEPRGPSCQIVILDNGTMVQNVGSTKLSSLINPGRPGEADVTTTTGSFYLSVDRPTGFSAAPQGGMNEVEFSTQFTGHGKTNFGLTPGDARVKLKNGLTNVEVHLEARKVRGAFPAGRYSATVTLRCE
jgi:hypothetical protein